MFSNIRKIFGWLVVIEVIVVAVAAYQAAPPDTYSSTGPHDERLHSLLAAWILISTLHGFLMMSGKPVRLVALAGLVTFVWLVWLQYNTTSTSYDPATSPIQTDLQFWLVLGAFLLPPIEQALDIFLPPWPWSKKD